MQRILGLDIGTWSIKVVALEASFRSAAVRSTRELRLLDEALDAALRALDTASAVPPLQQAETAPLPVPGVPDIQSDTVDSMATASPPETEQVRLWRKALLVLQKEGWLTADVVCCALPGASVASHALQFPFAERRQVDLALPGELESVVPLDMDEVVWDAIIAAGDDKHTDVLACVTRKDDVRALLQLLEEAGVDPLHITFSAASLAQWVAGASNPWEPTPVAPDAGSAKGADTFTDRLQAMLHMGHERTDVAVFMGQRLVYARTIAAGGALLARRIGETYGVDPELATQMLHAASLRHSDDPVLADALERGLSPLLRELRASIGLCTARWKRPLHRVVISGGGARLDAVDLLLTESLGIPVERWTVPSTTAATGAPAGGEWTQATALALLGQSSSRGPRVEFRKGEFASARVAGDWRAQVPWMVAAGLILLVLWGTASWAQLRQLARREARLDDALCEMTQKVLGKCERDYKVALGRLKGSRSPVASIPTASAVELAQTVSSAFPPDDATVLSDLDIMDSNVRLRGDAKSYESVDDLVGALQGNPCFKEVRKGKLSKRADNRIEFDLDAVYGCGDVRTKKAGG